jgi:hypothetical protein
MAGDLSFGIDKKTKAFQEYRQKTGAGKFDAFAAQYSWMDGGKYVSHSAPAAMFLQYPRTCDRHSRMTAALHRYAMTTRV